MTAQLIGGMAAGLLFGYVLQRGQQCFHATFRGAIERRWGLFKAWSLAVAIGAVGLAIVFAVGPWSQLSRGLPFSPVDNVVGGLIFGAGMAVAASCVSGLWYKLGAGMLGALLGLGAWAVGDIVGDGVPALGPTVLEGGDAATIPGVLGLPRWPVALVLALAVAAVLLRAARGQDGPAWQWRWPVAGVALGLVLLVTWAAAGASGASFGASTVGGAASLTTGSPAWWRVAFLVMLVPGAMVAARTAGGWWVRGETTPRYAGLAAGGFMLGAGGQIGGGCNLGHALSGVAQLNLSSVVAVAAMVAGIAAVRAVQVRLGRRSERPTTPA